MKVDVEFNDGQKISAGKYEFTAIHTPGHTPGSICLYDYKHRILLSGDTVFMALLLEAMEETISKRISDRLEHSFS